MGNVVTAAGDNLTVPSVQQDFVAWRQGRRHFAVWAIDLDVPALREACENLQSTLVDLWLPGYCRQPHLTVHLCGFPVPMRQLADDYGLAELLAQQQSLQQVKQPPFGLEIGLPKSFSSAAYFSVRDVDGGLAALRHLLAAAGAGLDGGDFTPHVTVGLYRDCLPMDSVVTRLREANRLPPFFLTVHQLALMVYEAAVVGGPLVTLGKFDLTAGNFEWLAPELLRELFGKADGMVPLA